MTRLLSCLIFILVGSVSYCQNETDLYRYSRTTFSGSARFESMAGSFGALGADLSSVAINPAGLGRFSRSFAEMTGSAGRSFNRSTFNGQETKLVDGNGGVSNLGMVITSDLSGQDYGILYQQFAFGFNRIESFNTTFRYQGQQYESLLDGFAAQAEGIDPSYLNDYYPFSTFVAYQTYALNYYTPTQSYYSLLNAGDVIHDRTVETKGGQNELFISYSINYLNKLYLGASAGFRHHKYAELTRHTETLTDTSGTPLRSFDYSYDLLTSGWGSNIKIGAIYLFDESLRAGFAFHSPTFGDLTDAWSVSMSSHFKDSSVVLAPHLVPTGNYRYRIRNPLRLIGSFAYVAGTRGCVNLDLEYIDYRMAHFKSTKDKTYMPYSYKIENEYAKTVFKPAFNVRLGGEYIIASVLYLRGGLAYYQKAFIDDVNVEQSGDLFVTTGAGIKTRKFYIDMALKLRFSEKQYFAFPESSAYVSTTNGSISLTAGINF